MKRTALVLACFATLIFVSCTSADKAVVESKAEQESVKPAAETEVVVPETETKPVVEKKPEEPKTQKGTAVKQEPVLSEADKEYARSVSNLSGAISKDEFVGEGGGSFLLPIELDEVIFVIDFEFLPNFNPLEWLDNSFLLKFDVNPNDTPNFFDFDFNAEFPIF